VGQKLKPLEVVVGLVKGVLLQIKTADLGLAVHLVASQALEELGFPAKGQMAVVLSRLTRVMEALVVVGVLGVLDLADLVLEGELVEVEH
jgi:hypothetical protein